MKTFVVSNTPARRVSSKDGRRSFHVQGCGLVGEDGLAQRFDLWINEGEDLYKPGIYVLDVDNSVYVNRQGNLSIRPVLKPAPAPASSKAA